MIGNGKQPIEVVYVGNCAWALVLAGEELTKGGALDGQAVFVTDQVGWLGGCSAVRA